MPKEPDIPKISVHPRRLTSLLITKNSPLLKCYPAHVVIKWGHKQWTYSERLWTSRWNFHIVLLPHFLSCHGNNEFFQKYAFAWEGKNIYMECKILWSHMIKNYNFIKPTTSQFTHGLFLSHYVSCETHNGHALPTPSCSFNMIVCWTKIHCCGQSSIQTCWVHFYFLKI